MITDRVCFSLTNDSKLIVLIGSGNLQHAPDILILRDLCFSISRNAWPGNVRIHIYIYIIFVNLSLIVFATIFLVACVDLRKYALFEHRK